MGGIPPWEYCFPVDHCGLRHTTPLGWQANRPWPRFWLGEGTRPTGLAEHPGMALSRAGCRVRKMLSFGFHPAIAKWFETSFGRPTEPQRLGWPAIFSGAHTLIAAPTGSGKTLAAFFAELNQLFQDGLHDRLDSATRVVYVSPLKALSNDIHKNLEEPLSGIRQVLLESTGKDVNVLAQVRTGDTPAAQRQAMIRRPPHILVTTPESFYLLLTSALGPEKFAAGAHVDCG
jgi:Lhr-like helicase